MNGIQDFFQAGDLVALRPLLLLTAGVLALVLAEVLGLARGARAGVFLATLLLAAWAHLGHVTDGPGLVLGGTYAADARTGAWGLLFLLSTFLAWVQARGYYRASSAFLGEHDLLLLTTPIGMSLMAGARDLVVFFIGLELLSIPLYCLAAFRRTRSASVEAGLKYFVLGAFSVAVFLYGAALVYTATGTLGIDEMRGHASLTSPLALAGIALLFASLLFKLSIFPFHLWVPDVYQGAPTPVTTLMATGTKAAALAFLLEVTFLLPERSATAVALLALVTMAVGNLAALGQKDLKRMLAWSGIAHAGTVLLLGAGARAAGLETEATRAALFYMAAYVVTAGGAFGLLAWLERDGEHFTRIDSLRGLARRRPGIAAAMALFLLSLGGIPATGGFLAKWFVFGVTVEAHLIAVTVAGALLSVVALGYYLRVIVAMYMQPEPEGQLPPLGQDASATFATAFCAALVLILGLFPGAFLDGVFRLG